MEKNVFYKSEFKSLKSKIMFNTVIPVIVVIIIAGALMTCYVRLLIDNMSRSEVSGSTALSCSRIDDIIESYSRIVISKAGEENIKRFLQTASERDEMEDNAYFSYTLGELDSAMSDYSGTIDFAWVASSSHEGVAFSNTSAGWTASEDFDICSSSYYHDLVMSKGYYVTDPYISPFSDVPVITVAAPVRDSRTNVILGVFGADIKLTTLWLRIAEMPESESNVIIIGSGDGTTVFHSDIDLTGGDFNSLMINELADDGVVKKFNMDGTVMIGSSESPDNSAWTVFSLRDYSETEKIKNKYTGITILVFAAVSVIMIIALTYASGKIAKPIQNYTRMINELKLDDENKINAENPEILVPQGCRELEHLAVGFNALIRRNSEMLGQLREMNIKSEKERILYQTALQSSSDVVFEYDIETDVLITYGSALDSTVPKTSVSSYDGFLQSIKDGVKYSADNVDYAAEFFSGDISGETILSKKMPDGTVHWLSFEGTAVRSEGIPVKVVGKIRCIDDVITLKEDAERDLFSGFYNKATTQAIIVRKLASSQENSAVILVDIDNFKTVNDIFGHDYGDFVIKDIADKIRSQIDSDTVVGRIGGDEFMLYVPSDDMNKISKLCENLCRCIKYSYTSENTAGAVAVSASIGAALFPEHGSNFDELYRSADVAMYVAKTGGKDRYIIFDDQERPEYRGRTEE